MANSPKDILILCLDVGHGMQLAPPGQISHLKKAIQIMSMLVHRKIFAQSKDELALVIFGCDETKNSLSDGESYSNISVKFPLGPADFDMLQYITQSISPGSHETDFLDAVTVCLDMMYNETRLKKVGCRRIVLFTNFDHPCSDDNIDGIINGFAAEDMNVELNIIGPSISLDDDDCDDDKPGPSSGPPPSDVDEVTKKSKSQQQLKGEQIVKRILRSGVAGTSYSYSRATQAASGFEKRSVRSAAWKCDLTLGQELSVPCVAYAKTKEAKMKQSWKKCHAKTHKESDVIPNRYFHKNDEDQTEVSKENIGKGYRYGKDIIPFGPDDEKQMKYSTDGKSLNLLGFTSLDNIPPWYMMDDQAHYILPDDPNAATGLHALIIAMQKQELCGVARYVYRRGTNPKMVALLPHIRNGYRCLVMVALPFSEDVRTLSFPSLESCKTSDEQLEAVDRLINHMTRDDVIEPKETLNPFFQYTYHCLHHRFLDQNGSLPEQTAIAVDPPRLAPNPHLDDVRRLFPLLMSARDASAQRWKSIELDENKDRNEKADDEAYQPLATILAPQVGSVGTVTPDSDFLAILQNSANDSERIDTAFKQLRDRIEGFVLDPFVSKLHNKIITGLKVLVEKSDQHKQIEATNYFLVKVKNKLINSHPKLWELLVENQINLIGDGEYDGNNRGNYHSVVQATVANPVYEEDTEQDADDLLDMMD